MTCHSTVQSGRSNSQSKKLWCGEGLRSVVANFTATSVIVRCVTVGTFHIRHPGPASHALGGVRACGCGTWSRWRA